MLWIVTIGDVEIPVRADSHRELMEHLENYLADDIDQVMVEVNPLPDMAEILSSSAIMVSRGSGHD